ncbi:MAG: cyclomaltodextrinase C-terminal domain-containing protein, partial [Flavobacteriales bacterium]|nr:cyclomaltodextrinase C-terminal domain-containing protein [Flavobacteriales bacterium]
WGSERAKLLTFNRCLVRQKTFWTGVDENDTFMILVNGNEKPHEFNLNRYVDFLYAGSQLTNMLDPSDQRGVDPIALPARGFALYRVASGR